MGELVDNCTCCRLSMELVELEDLAVLMIRIVSIRVSLTDQTTIIIVNK